MAEPTYPYGYGASMLTRAQLEAKETVYKLHPEFWRRYIALMEHADAQGVALGVGTGWRVQPNPPPPGFASPGNSNHEGFPADGTSGGAVAIDTVLDVSWNWMENQLAAYGLRSFREVNDEPWHIQPIELPASRSWRTEPWHLEAWPLPGGEPQSPPKPTPEEDDVVWRVAKRENGAYFIGDGKTAYWISGDSGDMDDDEALILMAPGAVNAVRVTWDKATDETAGPSIVTKWGQVKTTMTDGSIKKFIGATSRF